MEERPFLSHARDLSHNSEAFEPGSEAEPEPLESPRSFGSRWLAHHAASGPRRRRGALALAALAFGLAGTCAWRLARLRLGLDSSRLRGAQELGEFKAPVEDLCGKIEYDTEYHSSLSLYWVSNIRSQELCCGECDALPECNIWTYGSDDAAEGVARHCYLKKLAEGEEPHRINRTGVVSGTKQRNRRKHGVVSQMLSQSNDAGAVHVILENQTCPGQLNVSGYGTVSLIAAMWRTPLERGGLVEVPHPNWAVLPHLRGRAFFGDSCSVASTGQYARKEYTAMRLLGNTFRYTVDLSKAGCGCNAQLHLVPVRHNLQESKCHDYFCGHGFQHCGVSCSEIGIQDANQYSWSSNVHVHDDSAGPAQGYGGGKGWNGRRNWRGSQYGPGGECIDTSWPFDVVAAFPTWNTGLLKAVEVTLRQGGRSCPLSARIDEYRYRGRNGMVELTNILKEGVTPIIQYWGSTNFGWLDGPGEDGKGPCVHDAPGACPASVRFYDFAIEQGLPQQAGGEPSEGTVLMTAIDLVRDHSRKSAAEAERARLHQLQRQQEEKRLSHLPNASRKELNRLADGSEWRHEADTGAYMEWQDGYSEWEAVGAKVFVRNGSSFHSEILGFKIKGEIVTGERLGDWIKLAHEPGYMAVFKEGAVLLKERKVAYEKIVMGSCSSAGMFSIEDASNCMAAAFALGYFDSTVHISWNSHKESPEGCYLQDGQLFLSTAKVNKGKGVVGAMTPICASLAFPTTTTTTTTATTTTITTSTTSRTATTITTSTTTTSTMTTSTTTTITTSSTTTTTVTTMTTTSSTTWGYPSFFCIEVVRVHGFELPLVKAQQERHASIFGCEEYAVFSDGGEPQTVGIAPNGEEIRTSVIPPIKEAVGDLSKGATTNSWLNTQTFLQVWDLCKKDGRYKNHHWTVKVDPDAVFFPDRLRFRMKPHTMDNSKLFVMNCARYNPVALYGSMEIFSKGALDAYLAGQMKCRNSLPWHGWGEDFFMSHCMDMLGVGRIYDFDLLSDKRCIYRPCSDTSRVAYHDYKDARLDGTWFQCWRESLRR